MPETIDARFVKVEVIEPITDRRRLLALASLVMRAEARAGLEVEGLESKTPINKILSRIDAVLCRARPGGFPASLYSRVYGLRQLLGAVQAVPKRYVADP